MSNIIWKQVKARKKTVIVAAILFVLSAALAMVPAKIIQRTIDDAFYGYRLDLLFFYVGLLLGTFVAKAIFTLVSNNKLISLGNDILKAIKKAIYEKLLYMDLSFHFDNNIGYINARVEEVEKIDILFSSQTLTIGTSVLELIFTIVMLLSISPKMTIYFLFPIPFLLIVSFYLSKVITKQIKNTLDCDAEYSGKMQETLQGIETIKSQGTEIEETQKIDLYNRKALDSHKKQSSSMNKFSTGIGSISNIVTVVVYFIGGIFFIRGELTMGSFVAVSAYASKLYSPIVYFAGMSIAIQPAFLAMKRVSDFFFTEKKDEGDKGQALNEIHEIEFNKVCFFYNCERNSLLTNINLKIKKGDKIQLTGKNGSGKSTLIRLLLKMLSPIDGTILINGVNIQEIKKKDILNLVAYVPQKNFLFNESVQYNILYGISKYSQEKYKHIIDGLDLNTVAERIEKENEGKVGENGGKLSGGEIKKICIARALLRECPVIIFDEAMSNVDTNSIQFIINELQQENATIIVIDHSNDLEKIGFKKIALS